MRQVLFVKMGNFFVEKLQCMPMEHIRVRGCPSNGILAPVRVCCWWLWAWCLLACHRRPRRRRNSQDLSGWPSGQATKLRKQMAGNAAGLFEQDFGARLDGIVIWVRGHCFESFARGPSNLWAHTTYTKDMLSKSRGAFLFSSETHNTQRNTWAWGKHIDHGVVVGRIHIAIYSNI